jgi:hypothetical protein
MSGNGSQDVQEIEQNQVKEAQEEKQRVRDEYGSSSHSSSDFDSNDSSDVDSESDSVGSNSGESVGFSDGSDSDEIQDKAAAPLRVYDARFKIPAQSNLGELMLAKGSNDLEGKKDRAQIRKHEKMVKWVEGWKKFFSALIRFLMAVSMIVTMGLYTYNIVLVNRGRFFLARTR